MAYAPARRGQGLVDAAGQDGEAVGFVHPNTARNSTGMPERQAQA
jgi:hypothetical protein